MELGTKETHVGTLRLKGLALEYIQEPMVVMSRRLSVFEHKLPGDKPYWDVELNAANYPC
jgi:hypothetical protein